MPQHNTPSQPSVQDQGGLRLPEWVATLIGRKELEIEVLGRENERLRDRLRDLEARDE